MEESKIRCFYSAKEFFKMFGRVFRTMAGLRRIPEEERITPEFSERIMLAVTAVNKCGACSFLHTKTALEKGVQLEQIHEILEGEIGSFSDEEMPAVLYGQHFAETRGQVSAEARAKLVDSYGSLKARHIEGYISVVCFGNLCSNTVHARENAPSGDGAPRIGLGLYLLTKPIAAGIKNSGKRK